MLSNHSLPSVDILGLEKFCSKGRFKIQRLQYLHVLTQSHFIQLDPVPTRGYAWRLQTNKFRLIEFPSSPPARRAAPDPQLFSLGHVLYLASDVQRAQPRYRADKFLAFRARLDDVHLPVLTG